MASILLELLVRNGSLSKHLAEEIRQNARHADMCLSTCVLVASPISEERMARIVARMLGRAYFDPDQLRELPPVLREFLSMEQALRFRALPLRLVQQGLLVAMADPSDQESLQNLADLTGYPLMPQVAPEARLLQAIGRCYRKDLPAAEASLMARIVAAESLEQTFPKTEELDESLLEEAQVVEDEAGTAVARAGTGLQQRLAAAASREDVADALMDHLCGQFERLALFLKRDGTLLGWRALCGHQRRPGIGKVGMKITDSPLLQSVLAGQSPFLGPLAEAPLRAMLQQALGAPPQKAVLLPLVVAKRAVGILYVENGGLCLFDRVAELQQLLGKAACALEILILRKKLIQP